MTQNAFDVGRLWDPEAVTIWSPPIEALTSAHLQLCAHRTKLHPLGTWTYIKARSRSVGASLPTSAKSNPIAIIVAPLARRLGDHFVVAAKRPDQKPGPGCLSLRAGFAVPSQVLNHSIADGKHLGVKAFIVSLPTISVAITKMVILVMPLARRRQTAPMRRQRSRSRSTRVQHSKHPRKPALRCQRQTKPLPLGTTSPCRQIALVHLGLLLGDKLRDSRAH